jgi:hypothetical protein
VAVRRRCEQNTNKSLRFDADGGKFETCDFAPDTSFFPNAEPFPPRLDPRRRAVARISSDHPM